MTDTEGQPGKPQDDDERERSSAADAVVGAMMDWLKHSPRWAKAVIAILLCFSAICVVFWQVAPWTVIQAGSSAIGSMVERQQALTDRDYTDAKTERNDMIALLRELYAESRQQALQQTESARTALTLAQQTHEAVKQLQAVQDARMAAMEQRLSRIEARAGAAQKTADAASGRVEQLRKQVEQRGTKP